MNIRTITIAELDDFIQSGEYQTFNTLPITPERALSQSRNPHAKPSDPALWLALTEENDLLGFIGSLPAMDYRTGQRIGWNSCWWVDPEKGKDIAMPLFYTFLKQWDMEVAFSDMTANTCSIVDQMDFCHTRKEDFFFGYIHFCFRDILKSKRKLRYVLAPVYIPTIIISNIILLIRFSLMRSNLGNLQAEIKDSLDEEITEFVYEYCDREFSQRNETDFNWAFEKKWLVQDNEEAEKIGRLYPFSYECNRFEWKWVVTRNMGEINSVMLVSIRDHTLKVLYYYGDAPGFALFALKSLVIKDFKIRTIIFTHPDLVRNSSHLNSVLLWRSRKTRYTGISNKLMDPVPDGLLMQMGDGDALFT